MSFRRSPSLTASELFLFTFLQLAIFSTITTGQEPTICKYLITKQYECEVPRACTNVMRPPCKETVHGTWSDQDGKYVESFRSALMSYACMNTHTVQEDLLVTVVLKFSVITDIVHYYDVCIFTDHFTTCTFQPDFTYRCQMVWEQRRHPSGNYLGDARSGVFELAVW